MKRVIIASVLGIVIVTGIAHAEYILMGQQDRVIFTTEGQIQENWFNFGIHKTLQDCRFERKQAIQRIKYYVRQSKVLGETDNFITLVYIGEHDGLKYMDSHNLFCIPTKALMTKDNKK